MRYTYILERNQFELCLSSLVSGCVRPSSCAEMSMGRLYRVDEDDETRAPKPEHDHAHLKKIND